MARYSKTLTPEAQAAFLAALAGGALVAEAAAAAGVAVSSLYCRRGRDLPFAAAWQEAVEISAALPALPGGGRRRLRLAGRRAELFLAVFARDCHTGEAAAAAGVHRSTVYRRIARDPEFGRANGGALAQGYGRLGRELAAERAAAAARWRDHEIVPIGQPTQDFDEQMRLLARWTRPDGSIGPRRVRHGRMKRWTFDRAIAALARRLRGLGIPIRGVDDAQAMALAATGGSG